MPSNPRTSGGAGQTDTDVAPEAIAPPADANVDIAKVMDNDPADTTTQIPETKIDGPRIRAIPYDNGSTIVVRKADFADHGINHKTITFDFRQGGLTLPVVETKGPNYENEPVVEKAVADWLTSNYPMQFEYLNNDRGDSEKSE